MIWHPLLISVVIGDLLSLLLWLGAAIAAFQMIVKKVEQSVKREKIALEQRTKSARLFTKFSLVIFFLSTALLIIGITNVLPKNVAGSMCGTGVLQATDGLGGQALMYRFIVFIIMMFWLTLDKLNFSRPDAPLTMYNARLVLLALPFFLLTVHTTFSSFHRMDSHQPVDCCTLVHDQFGNLAAARQINSIPDTFWVWTFWLLTGLLLICAVWSIKTNHTTREKVTGILTAVTIIWVPLAAISLVRVYGVEFHQVLLHDCPWCLFLPEHKFVGIPLFGALIIVILEGPLSYLSAKTAVNFPELFPQAMHRSKLAVLKLLVAVVAYAGLVAAPAIYWRLIYGGWFG